MRRIALLFAFLMILAVVLPAQPVSLGVGAGLVVPPPEPDGTRSPSFAWGFHVNIPIISTLHLAPSSEIYRDGSTWATDNALAFKFIIPLRAAAVYFGVAPGLTAAGSSVAPHVGALGGVTVPVISNIGAFAQYKYKVLFQDGSNAGFSHLSLGLIFSF